MYVLVLVWCQNSALQTFARNELFSPSEAPQTPHSPPCPGVLLGTLLWDSSHRTAKEEQTRLVWA